jgi:Tfp pilus assembly protein PilO
VEKYFIPLISSLHFILIAWVGWGTYADFNTFFETRRAVEESIAETNQRVTKAQKTLGEIRDFESNIEVLKKRIDDIIKQIDEMKKSFPETIVDAEILGDLSKEATSLNLQTPAVAPREEFDRGFYFAKQFEMKARGTYLQFIVFFERLSKKQKIFNVQYMKIFNDQTLQKGRYGLLNIETLIESFRYNHKYKIPAIEVEGSGTGDGAENKSNKEE